MTIPFRYRRRKFVSALAVILCGLAVVLALTPLAFILFYVLKQGLVALNWDFFTQMPKPVGETGGGMANAIVGTIILIAIAAAFAVPVGILTGIHLSEYPRSRMGAAVRFAADVLNGVPSIVIGIFAYAVLVMPFKRFSALAGGLALGVMMLPIVTRTTEELLRLVPSSLKEGALALGATRSRAVFTVVFPAALPGILTGVLVAIARVAGETAPLLFTAFNNRFWSTSLTQPIGSLTVQVFTYAISPYEDWHRQAWAGAFLLVMMILVFSIAARIAVRRLERMNRGI
ncbi:MAG: phosphate ABC transporter permease PstA [Acidobacteriota bacterium]